MSDGCDFTLRHYHEILKLAEAAGYRFSHFRDVARRAPRLILRHDLDFQARAALPMARLEAELGISASYFVLLTAGTSNPFEPAESAALREIASLGHRIGLHLDERAPVGQSSLAALDRVAHALAGALSTIVPVEPVVSFHMPSSHVLGRDLPTLTSVYGPRFFKQMVYRSDSGRQWQHGCICECLRTDPPSELHLLIHPIWWSNRPRNEAGTMRSLQRARHDDVNAYLGGFRPFAPLLGGTLVSRD